MPSIILSDNGVSSGSAGLKSTAASDGALALQTTTAGGVATTAISIDTSQNVTFANQPTFTGGTANGVLYLNGSKAVTSGSALVFDGTNVGVGTASPAYLIDVNKSGAAYKTRWSDGTTSASVYVGGGVGGGVGGARRGRHALDNVAVAVGIDGVAIEDGGSVVGDRDGDLLVSRGRASAAVLLETVVGCGISHDGASFSGRSIIARRGD